MKQGFTWLMAGLLVCGNAFAEGRDDVRRAVSNLHDSTQDERYPLLSVVSHEGERVQLYGYFKPSDRDVDADYINELVGVVFPSSEARLEFSEQDGSYESVTGVHGTQWVGPLEVMGGEITVTIENGAVISLSGHRATVGSREVDIAAALNSEGHTGLIWHVQHGPVVQRIVDGRLELVAPGTEDVLDRSMGSAEYDSAYQTASCKVRHNKLSPTNLRDWGSTVSASSSGTMNCGRQSYSPTCIWELSREGSGVVHQLGRVDDSASSDALIVGNCSDPAGLFNYTDAGRVRQQNVFYYAGNFRAHLFTRMWDKVTRDQHANVVFSIVPTTSCGSNGCFNSSTVDIQIKQDRADVGRGVQTVMHEYGHYVNWTYGHFSPFCNAGSDEGKAINEAVASVIRQTYFFRDPEIDAKYNSVGVVIGVNLDRHVDGGNVEVYTTDRCGLYEDEHIVGHALEQAMWELLWNHDCATGPTTCPTNLSTFGNDIWQNTGKAAVGDVVAESLAYALKATGKSITFNQFLFFFLARVQTLTGSQARINATNVLVHHGFSPFSPY